MAHSVCLCLCVCVWCGNWLNNLTQNRKVFKGPVCVIYDYLWLEIEYNMKYVAVFMIIVAFAQNEPLMCSYATHEWP